MRIVFMGSPAFSVPILEKLDAHFQVAAVVTQPDRPAGRGRKLRISAVKKAALERGLTIFQPDRLEGIGAQEQLSKWQPDLFVVAAFGQILKPEILSIPRLGSVNVHASLLPRWRGAAPVQAAILHGDDKTGVTIMLMDAGLDTGPILSQESIPIDLDITGGELAEELSILGANLLVETLPKYAEAELAPQNQDDKKATYAPMLKKKDGLLDFHKSAAFLGRQVRAYEPWPTSFLMWDTLRIVVRKAVPLPDASAAPGEVILKNGKPAVGTTDGALLLSVVQPAGRKRMPGDAFLNGSPDFQTANLLRDD